MAPWNDNTKTFDWPKIPPWKDRTVLNAQLKRCLPCKHCGKTPVYANDDKYLQCAEYRDTKGNSKTGMCCSVYIYSNKDDDGVVAARSRWNRFQRNSDTRYLDDRSWYEAQLQAREEIPITSESPTEEVLKYESIRDNIYRQLLVDGYQEQVAASRAHATRLGKLANLRKEKIKILQEELAKLSSLCAKLQDINNLENDLGEIFASPEFSVHEG